MKSLLLASSCVLLALAAGACAPRTPPMARTALDCPPEQGDLARSSVAPDGKSCLYTSRDGDQISLRLIPVSGSYQATLAPIEQELKGEVQTEQEAAAARAKESDDATKAATTASAKNAAEVAKQAANDALGQARDSEAAAKDPSDVDVTRIDLPGIHISADDSNGGRANVNVGSIHVNAGDEGAEIRVDKPVRLRGEALSPQKRGFRATYILANDRLKDGWRAVGYEAGGPQSGPITVAVVKSRSGEHDHVLDDVKRLVRRNGGV